MDYTSKTHNSNGQLTPSGEVCIKGPGLFTSYFRKADITTSAFDKEGWFHTGDIGIILPEIRGFSLIGKKKEIFRLSQGEYISPSKLESVFAKSKYVKNVCVLGNFNRNKTVTLVSLLKKRKKISEEEGNIERINDFISNNDMSLISFRYY